MLYTSDSMCTEALPYLLQQVPDHQEALSSQHLLLHCHGALEQLDQKGQESGTAKQEDGTLSRRDTIHTYLPIHTLIAW